MSHTVIVNRPDGGCVTVTQNGNNRVINIARAPAPQTQHTTVVAPQQPQPQMTTQQTNVVQPAAVTSAPVTAAVPAVAIPTTTTQQSAVAPAAASAATQSTAVPASYAASQPTVAAAAPTGGASTLASIAGGHAALNAHANRPLPSHAAVDPAAAPALTAKQQRERDVAALPSNNQFGVPRPGIQDTHGTIVPVSIANAPRDSN